MTRPDPVCDSPEPQARILALDDFSEDRVPGDVIGRTGRSGRDREGSIGIDGGSARLGYLEVPGWDRQTLSQGPYEASPGLVTCWLVINAHNTSMTHVDRPIGRKARLKQFVKGLPQLHWREPDIDDNLTVGWYPHSTSRNPTGEGWPLIMHSGDTVNGVLETRVSGVRHRLVAGIQNIPIFYVQIRRPNDLLHCVATTLDTGWSATAPEFRPVAIDPNPPEGPIHASVHQSIQGEVKYRIDTRIESFVAMDDPAWVHRNPATLWSWQPGCGPATAQIQSPASLLVVRADGPVQAKVDGDVVDIEMIDGFGQLSLIDEVDPASTIDLSGVEGLTSAEVIAAKLTLPELTPKSAWKAPVVETAALSLPTATGKLREQPGWERTVGHGEVVCNGDGSAVVVGDVDHPNPGRTVHTTSWEHPEGVELVLRQRPPGSRGQGHKGRSGVCVMQDPDNLLIVNNWLDDSFDGASISCFARLHGREIMYDYDAVWSNVGHAVRHGVEHELRVVVEHSTFAVWLDGEPVMLRRFHDMRPDYESLHVNRVGVASNWEWGDDTGTEFISLAAGRIIR